MTQFLVGFGNLIGRGPFRQQGGIHHLNLFAVLVGASGVSRKGTSWTAIENLLEAVDRDWITKRKRDSFQSGEAIIHAVRDSSGNKKSYDPGETDKRLLIVEEEFARLLEVANRPGNTLSATLRKLWEGRKYQYTEAKLSREKATGAHVSLIGHITANELLNSIAQIKNKNGFSNRIMWIPTRRTKKIALPEWIDWNNHRAIIDHLLQCTHIFKTDRPMDWATAAKKAWRDYYESLSEPKSGILAGLISRADPQVLRLSMLYAVLDQSSLISEVHLRAAIAFWNYAAAGAKWVFGPQKTGDRMADKLFWFLNRRPAGMTRNEIAQEVFKRNAASADIERALSTLVDADLVFVSLERSGQAKKPAERWQVKRS